MKLSWSHTVLNARDEKTMLTFYTETMGFSVSDRGLIGDGAADIIFLSQQADEHHQLALVTARKDSEPSNSLNHMAFRLESFEDLQVMKARLKEANVGFMPLSHGNTLSFYFADPEGNGLEVFWDTPWHVSQPEGQPWDPDLSKDDALRWVEDTFKDKEVFVKRDEAKFDWVNRP